MPQPPSDPPVPSPPHMPPPSSKDQDAINFAFLKGPKRKRLAKACDACHKSKRRCDGTAPCSNCTPSYFASKGCTYTDASGNPVPAPRANRDPSEPRRRTSGAANNAHHHPVAAPANGTTSYNATEPSTSGEYHDRKRFRYDSEGSSVSPDPPYVPRPGNTFPTSRLDPCIVRELVNLFFAHCHPQRFIIHKPTFCAALSHGRIPCSLLYAMCAMAAPLSKQPAVRTSPPRIAGNPYAQEAIAQLFDKGGRLIAESNLVTVQALCILQSHEILAVWPWTASMKYQELALKILEEDLHVHSQNNPVLTPVPTPDLIFTAIDRECTRRAFWLIRFLSITSNMYYDWPMPQKAVDLTVRLPVDETSFELAVHSTLSEYLHVPAPRTQWVSEYGHLLRVSEIYWTLESTLRAATGGSGPVERGTIEGVVQETERALSTWEASLADHVKFTDDSLQLQLSMFETSSNAGAWSYFLMHIMHASCILSLLDAKSHTQPAASPAKTRQWARDRIMLIITSLGSRAKNSLLLVAALVPLYKHSLGDHPQITTWTKEFEEMWGTKLPTLQLSRPHPPATSPILPPPRARAPPSPPPPFVAMAQAGALPPPFSLSAHDFTMIHDSDAGGSVDIGRPYRSMRQFGDISKAHVPKQETSPTIPPSSASGSSSGSTSGALSSPSCQPSLPSLKACGLLDSTWLPPPAPSAGFSPSSLRATDTANANGGLGSPASMLTPPWAAFNAQAKKTTARAPSEASSSGLLSAASHPRTPTPTQGEEGAVGSSRGARSTLPVGLHWLGDEP
ncbi:hypothetical protein DENSPDRAFT_878458 [Dentipellis sp. KUC8613]|nr:hypothetical protein DENSPDRAFT_878458 [Dentipellis sp. KUC8613]